MSENKKRALRVGEDCKVSFREITGNFLSGSHGKNISETGFCIPLTHHIPVGSLLEVSIRSVDLASPVKAVARIAWITGRRGKKLPFEAGLEFLTLGVAARNDLREFIERSAARGANRHINWVD